jgi:hypothetical protein
MNQTFAGCFVPEFLEQKVGGFFSQPGRGEPPISVHPSKADFSSSGSSSVSPRRRFSKRGGDVCRYYSVFITETSRWVPKHSKLGSASRKTCGAGSPIEEGVSMERASNSIPTQPPGASYLPGFGRCGIPQASPSSLSRITCLRTAALVGRNRWACPATAFRSRP